MQTPSRILVALAVAVLSNLAVLAPPASAGKPVEIGQCEINVYVPLTTKSITIPICSNGPPL